MTGFVVQVTFVSEAQYQTKGDPDGKPWMFLQLRSARVKVVNVAFLCKFLPTAALPVYTPPVRSRPAGCGVLWAGEDRIRPSGSDAARRGNARCNRLFNYFSWTLHLNSSTEDSRFT
ncbi:hypothetical protein QQF64_029294 [Cirrhinus molitorella]|uniref:Uncharacterized protein n=1 Tax=Cirrhinus molitorella TaxID=172907 RepID=A0ABR3N9L8_9TELE